MKKKKINKGVKVEVSKKPTPKKKCNTCWGFGLWGVGDACPMGRMDASDGCPTQKCPECGANPNPYK